MLLRSHATPSSIFESLPYYGRVLKPCHLWTSASSSFNFFTDNMLCDWLRLYHPESNEDNLFLKELANKGIQFEQFILNDLRHRLKLDITSISNRITPKTLQETLNSMKRGIPIIHSAPLKSSKYKIKGVADFLIRSDKLHLICPDYAILKPHSSNFSNEWYYIVVDVKFKTFNLKKNGMTPYHSPNIDAYTFQLWAYTQAVAEYQGYNPNYAFLMGRKYECTSKREVYRNYDDKLVQINFDQTLMSSKYNDAIKWISDVKFKGKQWTLVPHPTRKELYPNMNGIGFTSQKQNILKQLDDITRVWNCTGTHRTRLMEQGIFSMSNPRCTAQAMGFTGWKQNVIQQILDVNHTPSIQYLPLKVHPSLFKKYNENEYYVDFEVIPSALMDTLNSRECNTHSFLFLIGIGWGENNNGIREWKFKSFMANALTPYEEKILVKSVINFIPKDSTLFHWGNIEPSLWKTVCNRHSLDFGTFNWEDLSKKFIKTPITIKGAYDFKLKHVASAMYDQNMISSRWDSGTLSGMDYATLAYLKYKHPSVAHSDDEDCFNSIVRYNEMDCKVLWEMLNYFRVLN